jgi:hypothetical protein
VSSARPSISRSSFNHNSLHLHLNSILRRPRDSQQLGDILAKDLNLREISPFPCDCGCMTSNPTELGNESKHQLSNVSRALRAAPLLGARDTPTVDIKMKPAVCCNKACVPHMPEPPRKCMSSFPRFAKFFHTVQFSLSSHTLFLPTNCIHYASHFSIYSSLFSFHALSPPPTHSHPTHPTPLRWLPHPHRDPARRHPLAQRLRHGRT